jgi:hypothetical protein
MAGRSEKIDALLAELEDMVAAEFVEAAVAKHKEVEGKSADDRLAVATAVAKAGRYVKLFRGRGGQALKAINALRPAKASDVEETAMNDDASKWTPERVEALHAQVRERLDKLAGSRELKNLVERKLQQSGRALPGDPAGERGPSKPA